MNEEKLHRRIRDLAAHTAPDCLDEIMASCDKARKGNVIVMTKVKTRKRFIPLAVAAALLLVCLGGFAGYGAWNDARAVDSVVMLDVNPSISISVNAKEQVLAVTPLNDDARKVVGDMDFAGSSLDVTVNALVGSMLLNGYLDDIKNSILVSVENGDAAKAAALQEKVTDAINTVFATDGLEPAVLTQTVTENSTVKELAEQYGISVGKAELIQKLVAQDPTLSFASLAGLSMTDIALIANSRGITDESVTQTGTASAAAYIGEAAAKAAAFARAGVAESEISQFKLDFDSENGVMVYEVEFNVGNQEYEIDVNATTGEIVKFELDLDDDHISGSVSASPAPGVGESLGEQIGEAAAKLAALIHAGVSESELSHFQIELDRDDGRLVYDVDFTVNGTEYDIEIDAYTGQVLKYETERDDDHYAGGTAAVTTPQPGTTAAEFVGDAAARLAALTAAGLDAGSVYGLESELDRENGAAVYEVGFHDGTHEYDYLIDALTGAVLGFEKEIDD